MTKFTRKAPLDRFINEEHFFNNLNKVQQGKYYKFAMFVFVFCFVSLFVGTFFPFTFIDEFGILKFVFALIFEIISVVSFIILIIQEYKFNIFKKKYQFFIFFLVFFVIAAVGIVVGQLNTTFTIDSIGLLKSHSNVIYFFVIFTPLYFGYFNFTWYAFFKTLAKYRK